jgi:hypothetical protein
MDGVVSILAGSLSEAESIASLIYYAVTKSTYDFWEGKIE